VHARRSGTGEIEFGFSFNVMYHYLPVNKKGMILYQDADQGMEF